VEYLPTAEGPARTAKALLKLGKALAALYGHKEIEQSERRVLAQIGADSIPSIRGRILASLASEGDLVRAKDVGAALGLPTFSVSRLFEDLAVLGIVSRVAASDSQNAPFDVRMEAEFKDLLIASGVGSALVQAYPPENAVGEFPPTAKSQGYSKDPDSKQDTGDNGLNPGLPLDAAEF
jgi:hypothetical protein